MKFPTDNMQSPPARRLMPAAEYVRMSTDFQQVSISYQQAAIRDYARKRGLAVVQTYIDEGRSGLTLEGRPGLKQLLDDVLEHRANFEIILVYDVSRWGRFQDTDESGFYEYICRKNKVHVEYVAELFENDGGPLSAIMKSVKRSMAAEYSREQSERVYRSILQIARRGFFSGGKPGYGYRRLLVSAEGTPRQILERGSKKAVRTDRVTLTLGPVKEVRTVRRIFRLYVNKECTPLAIAKLLNSERIPNDSGRKWCQSSIQNMLRNERYIGTLVYDRRTTKLKRKPTQNDPSTWLKVRQAFKPIVSEKIFAQAQERLRARAHIKWNEEALLEHARRVWADCGYLSATVLRGAKPDYKQYRSTFGSMGELYNRLGYFQSRDHNDHGKRERVLAVVKHFRDDLTEAARSVGMPVRVRQPEQIVELGGRLRLALKGAPYTPSPVEHRKRWLLNISRRTTVDYTIAIRIDPLDHSKPMDYFLVPTSVIKKCRMKFGDHNEEKYRPYHFISRTRLLGEILSRADDPGIRP